MNTFVLPWLHFKNVTSRSLNWLLRLQKRRLPPYASYHDLPLYLAWQPSVPAKDSPHKLPISNSSQRQLNLMSHIKHILQTWGLLVCDSTLTTWNHPKGHTWPVVPATPQFHRNCSKFPNCAKYCYKIYTFTEMSWWLLEDLKIAKVHTSSVWCSCFDQHVA